MAQIGGKNWEEGENEQNKYLITSDNANLIHTKYPLSPIRSNKMSVPRDQILFSHRKNRSILAPILPLHGRLINIIQLKKTICLCWIW